MFNDMSTLQTYLTTRRSAKPKEMKGAHPDLATLRTICDTALRTPDHGKLAPWRIVIVPDEDRPAFEEAMQAAYRKSNPDAPDGAALTAAKSLDHDAALVLFIFSPKKNAKIPLWEQELSAGAAAMNLLHAVHAHGYHPGWLTPWPVYDNSAHDLLCQNADEKIAGFIYIGTAGTELTERPRPDPDDVISIWQR